MGYAVRIYEAFRDLGEERARILAEFAEEIEKRKGVTLDELKETELILQKGIEETRLEIEQVRKEIGETKSSLLKWMFLFWVSQMFAIAGVLAKLSF